MAAAPGRGRSWAIALAVLVLARRASYPVRGHLRAQGRLRRAPTLDGLGGCAHARPGDVARDRLAARPRAGRRGRARGGRARTTRAFGHARISTFTGRPTVLGWPGHELQWEHDPGTRQAGRRDALHDHRPAAARARCSTLRRRLRGRRAARAHDYGDAGVAKWDQLGRRVFDRDGTTIWRRSSGALGARRATRACRPSGSTACAW